MNHAVRKTVERDGEGNFTAITEIHTSDLGFADGGAYASLSPQERRLGEVACYAAAKRKKLTPEELRLALIVNRHRMAL
jgi:hypothetical protein